MSGLITQEAEQVMATLLNFSDVFSEGPHDLGLMDLVSRSCGKSGITTDPENVEAVRSWTDPTSVEGVRSFVGLCSSYRRFIPGFSDIAQPLF